MWNASIAITEKKQGGKTSTKSFIRRATIVDDEKWYKNHSLNTIEHQFTMTHFSIDF